MNSSFPYLRFLLLLEGDFPFCPLVPSIFLENPSASLFPFSFLFVPHLPFATFWYCSSLCSSPQFQAMFRFTSISVSQSSKLLAHALYLSRWFLHFALGGKKIKIHKVKQETKWDVCRSHSRMKIRLLHACLHTAWQPASLNLELIHAQ